MSIGCDPGEPLGQFDRRGVRGRGPQRAVAQLPQLLGGRVGELLGVRVAELAAVQAGQSVDVAAAVRVVDVRALPAAYDEQVLAIAAE